MNRRNFLKKTFWASTAIGTGTGLYTWQIEPFWLEYVHLEMPIRHLPDSLIGKTLMQISDIHVGNRFDYNYIIESFKEAQDYNPDFVAYTGDYISYENEEQLKQLDEVMEHIVLGKIGTIAILGNHDYGFKWEMNSVANDVANCLEKHGATVLRNEDLEVEGLNFIGFDDYWGPNFNTSNLMGTWDPSKANVALCHNPDACDLDIWNGYDGWILSGHTHGGQCKPPFLEPPMLPVVNKNYSAGEIDLEDGRKLYINRALGHLWQVRFNVRPEITIFTLKKE